MSNFAAIKEGNRYLFKVLKNTIVTIFVTQLKIPLFYYIDYQIFK